jgi:hypothetical protein
MAWMECKAVIEAAAGREFTNEEILKLTDAAEIKLTKKMRRGLSKREATAEARAEITQEALLQAMIARRTAYINRLVWQDLTAVSEATKAGQQSRAVIAALNGVASGTSRGLASGVYPKYFGIRDGKFLGPLAAMLDKAGLRKAVQRADPTFDRDIARELFRRLDPDSAPATGNSRAVQAAQILGDMQEVARIGLNKAGAWVAKIDNYIARQSHDPLKIGRASEKEWIDYIKPRLDLEKSFGDDNPDEQLSRIYKSLKHETHGSEGNPVLRAFGGPGSLGKKVSQSRSLIFQGADQWYDYNAKFGKGNVLDAVVTGLDRAARDIALMDRFGTNPEMMFERWVADLKMRARDLDAPMGKGWFNNVNSLGDLFNTVSGFSSSPGNATISHVGTFARDMQQLSKLGGVWISALPDLVNTAATLRHNGIPIWQSMLGQLAAILPNSPARRELAFSLGAAIDNSMGAMIHRFRAGDEVNGSLSKAVGIFHKLNLLAPWTDAMKEGVSLSLSANMAFHASKTFDKLPPLMQTTLRRYEIEATEWDALRATQAKALDGRRYILPSEVADEKLADKLRTYIVDQTREALTEPTARVRTVLALGTTSGTVEGEFARTIAQFKSFSATFMERHLGRELSRDGVNVPGIITLAVGLTFMGMVSLQLKEIVAGRYITWPDDPRQAAELFAKAFIQGGAGGLIADALLRDAHGYSGGFIESVIGGPTAGTIEDTLKFFQSVVVGDETGRRGRGEIAARLGVPLLQQNVPGANLLWTKALMEYLFIFRLQESINPGYIHRYEKKVRDSGREFILRPSETAR